MSIHHIESYTLPELLEQVVQKSIIIREEIIEKHDAASNDKTSFTTVISLPAMDESYNRKVNGTITFSDVDGIVLTTSNFIHSYIAVLKIRMSQYDSRYETVFPDRKHDSDIQNVMNNTRTGYTGADVKKLLEYAGNDFDIFKSGKHLIHYSGK